MRTVLLLFIVLSLAAAAQDVYVLNWLEADLDGDKVPERVLVVSSESPDPNVKSKKELRVMKRKGAQLAIVYSLPLEESLFHSRMSPWQLQEPATRLWGLNYEPPRKGRRASVMVNFSPNSGEFFWLLWNGKAFVTESSGD